MNNIFSPLPMSSKAVRCEDHKTISLISHTAKIVLNLEDGKGININGQNITNIRYADDTIIFAESEQQLQHMIDKLDQARATSFR